MWCETLVFYVEGADCMTLNGYKGLPQGSVLSLFLYNLLGSGMDRFVLSGCNFLQYADDIVMYSSHHVLQTACALVQTACSLLSVFFMLLGLMIPLTKSLVVLSSQRHLQPSVSIRIGGRLLQQSESLKYLGVFFDAELRQGTHTQAKYVQKRCLQRLIFLKLVAGVW
jgi:hypothetical protein